MNQDQVIERLLRLRSDIEEFKVTFSGKTSKKVDGLYKLDNREIIIHNKNFNNDNALMYTAIHEFAHHIQYTTTPVTPSSRAHTKRFWSIFHSLLETAEHLGIYNSVYKADNDFKSLTEKIKKTCLQIDGRLMKELGGLLVEAIKLCKKTGSSFEDYVDRELQLARTTANSVIKIFKMDLDPEIGYENMKTLSSIKDDNTRQVAKEALQHGESPQLVRARYISKPDPEDHIEVLIKEKHRIEKGINRLTHELEQIEIKIKELSK